MDRKDARLLDMRLGEEEQTARAEAAFADKVTVGAPPVADAQLVLGPNGLGVAIRGARFVIPLPKGYGGPALELALIDRGRFIATHPNHPPLLLDPQAGTARPF